jgi:hypothetical protein
VSLDGLVCRQLCDGQAAEHVRCLEGRVLTVSLETLTVSNVSRSWRNLCGTSRKRTPKSCAHTQRCALEDWINQLTLCLIKKSRFSFRKEQKSRCGNSTYENAEALRAWTTSHGVRALTAATAFSLQRAERCDQICPCNLNGQFTCCSRFARRSMERLKS